MWDSQHTYTLLIQTPGKHSVPLVDCKSFFFGFPYFLTHEGYGKINILCLIVFLSFVRSILRLSLHTSWHKSWYNPVCMTSWLRNIDSHLNRIPLVIDKHFYEDKGFTNVNFILSTLIRSGIILGCLRSCTDKNEYVIWQIGTWLFTVNLRITVFWDWEIDLTYSSPSEVHCMFFPVFNTPRTS